MRSSELRGLRWRDVDFDNYQVTVTERADKFKVIDVPKSQSDHRTIPVPPLVVNTLREWKVACPKGPLGLVFPNGDGNIEDHANIIKRGYQPAQVAAGVTRQRPMVDKEKKPVLDDDRNQVLEDVAKYPGLHALRHFFASWCINRKASGGLELPAMEVQYRMGHSSIQQTMDTYSHLFPSKDDRESLADAERQLLPVMIAT